MSILKPENTVKDTKWCFRMWMSILKPENTVKDTKNNNLLKTKSTVPTY